MYITLLAASPCAKTVSFLSNLPTFLPRPVESRNDFTSNAELLEFVFRGERGVLAATRVLAEDCMPQNSIRTSAANCAILHSLIGDTQRIVCSSAIHFANATAHYSARNESTGFTVAARRDGK